MHHRRNLRRSYNYNWSILFESMVWHPHRVNKYRRIWHGIQSYSKLHYTGQRWNNRSTWHGYKITSANAIMVQAECGWCRGYWVRRDWRVTESAGCRDSARPRLSGGQQKLAMLVVRRQIHLSRANGSAEFRALTYNSVMQKEYQTHFAYRLLAPNVFNMLLIVLLQLHKL